MIFLGNFQHKFLNFICWVRCFPISNKSEKQYHAKIINANFSTRRTALVFKNCPKVCICWKRHKSDGCHLDMDYFLYGFAPPEDDDNESVHQFLLEIKFLHISTDTRLRYAGLFADIIWIWRSQLILRTFWQC